MASKRESSTSDNDGSARKRVCKACNRCRLKKSKCDGASPCGRCKADDVVCTFGERKRVLDKVHPRGYVELLEQQQAQLVAGIRAMWHDVSTDHEWKREALPNEGSGKVFVHDILDRIGALKAARDYSPDQSFMEEPEQMQEWLATQSHFQNRLPSPPEDSPYQSPAISSRPAPQQIAVETPIDTFTSHSSSPLGSSSPSTAASSALHTPTSPHFDAHPHDMSWLHPSTPISSTEESWLSSPFLFNTAPPEAYKPGSALKPHAFLTGEVDALLAGFDTSNF